MRSQFSSAAWAFLNTLVRYKLAKYRNARKPSGTDGEVRMRELPKAGNIDQPGSEAYNRWGAGREASIASSDARQLARNDAAVQPSAVPGVPGVDTPIPLASSGIPGDKSMADLEGAKQMADLDESTRLAAEQRYNAQAEDQTFDPHEASQSQFSKEQWDNTPDPVLSNPVNAGMSDLPDMYPQ